MLTFAMLNLTHNLFQIIVRITICIISFKETHKTKDSLPGKSSSFFPDCDPTLKGFSLTLKFLQKNSVSPEERMFEGFNMESRIHILNPKYSTPTSLPLYFFFVYQLLQESKNLEKFGPVS